MMEVHQIARGRRQGGEVGRSIRRVCAEAVSFAENGLRDRGRILAVREHDERRLARPPHQDVERFALPQVFLAEDAGVRSACHDLGVRERSPRAARQGLGLAGLAGRASDAEHVRLERKAFQERRAGAFQQFAVEDARLVPGPHRRGKGEQPEGRKLVVRVIEAVLRSHGVDEGYSHAPAP